METTLQLVTLEQAVALKEAGFDWPVIDFTRGDGPRLTQEQAMRPSNINLFAGCTSRPTVQHALMWLREAKGILVTIIVSAYDGKVCYKIYSGKLVGMGARADFNQAESAGLTDGLEVLPKQPVS